MAKLVLVPNKYTDSLFQQQFGTFLRIAQSTRVQSSILTSNSENSGDFGDGSISKMPKLLFWLLTKSLMKISATDVNFPLSHLSEVQRLLQYTVMSPQNMILMARTEVSGYLGVG